MLDMSSTDNTRHIAVVTSSRADWGLLSAPAAALRDTPGVRLSIVAANMHLSRAHGHTIDEIIAAGFDVAARVPLRCSGDSPLDRTVAMGQCLSGMGRALDRLRPDCVVMLGDRYEMLAAASAAAMLSIPIVHLHGGEMTLGAIDDAMRHAITKLATLHLASTEQHRRRIIAMGVNPELVINTGAIGVWNALHTELPSHQELIASLDGFDINDHDTLVVTYHPATADLAVLPAEQFAEFLRALDRRPHLRVLFTGTNNDAGGAAIAKLTEQWVKQNRHRARCVKSLGYKRYLAALRDCAACVGNSSSGIIEAPSMRIPTIDIGMRQHGRTASQSVIHCGYTADEVLEALQRAMSDDIRAIARKAKNPYEHPDTLALIVDSILTRCPSTPQTSFDPLSLS